MSITFFILFIIHECTYNLNSCTFQKNFFDNITLKLYNLYLYISISKGCYILRRAKKPYKMVDVIYGRPQRDNSFCPMVLSLATNKLSEINPNIAGHFQIKDKKVFFKVRFFFFFISIQYLWTNTW